MRQTAGMTTAIGTTARERARADITQEILETGRVHLARDGAAALSLRAVARDLGMVSSAVYRYVPNRDALLTMLIIAAYDSVGAAVEKAEGAVPREDYLARFLAVGHAMRTWAVSHPQEYALIFGSPVPGYAAPQDTIVPATRVPAVLITIIVDLTNAGRAPMELPVDSAVRSALAPVLGFVGSQVSADLILRGLAAWAALLGTISLELFGHLHNVVASGARARKAYFDEQMRRVASDLGLTGD